MAAELRELGVPSTAIIEKAQSFTTRDHFLHCSAVARERRWKATKIGILAPFWQFGRITAMMKMMMMRPGVAALRQPYRPVKSRSLSVLSYCRTVRCDRRGEKATEKTRIESSFATVRHRAVRSKGCLSNKTALAMIFKLAEAAERSWRRLAGRPPPPTKKGRAPRTQAETGSERLIPVSWFPGCTVSPPPT